MAFLCLRLNAVNRRAPAASAEGGAAQQAKWLRQCHWIVWMVAGGTVLLLMPGSGLGKWGRWGEGRKGEGGEGDRQPGG